jgi:hypothetical protein
MANVVIRASSLGGLFDCAARWKAIHIDGKQSPNSGRALLGTAVHASAALFDQSAIDGQGITINESIGAAIDAIEHPEHDVVWNEDITPSDAKRIASLLHIKYCTDIAPRFDYAAVEVTCDKLEINDLGITLTGTTDRIFKTDDGYGVADIKTGKTVVGADGSVKAAEHLYQVGVYELLASQSFGVRMSEDAQIIGLSTGKSNAVATAKIEGAVDALLGDGDNMGALEMASKIIQHELFVGNPRSMLCSKKYCPIYNSCKWRR